MQQVQVGASERARFERDGFVVLPGLLEPELLRDWRPRIREAALGCQRERAPGEARSTYERAFVQAMNLWQHDARVRPFVLAPELAAVARQLLGVEAVRLYHDQALLKEAGGGHTPWHVDQAYWPLASDRVLTLWIPLVDVPLEMGPLAFAAGSHRLEVPALPIGDESEAVLAAWVAEQGLDLVEAPFALGDVSAHLGRTLHRAGPNRTERERTVMTVILMDAGMRLAEPASAHQVEDRETWLPGVEVGAVCDSPLNPIVPG